MSVKIIVDSAVDMSEKYCSGAETVPLTVRFGDEEYRDRVDLDAREFYAKLIDSDVMPTTSQANISQFSDVFEREVKAGNDVVVITVSSKLSGTYHSACIAAEEYPGRVFVVDSMSVSIGAGILAEFALLLADAGLRAPGIVKRLMLERNNVKVLAVFNTLEYLKRGGRISQGAAFAGSLLSIKPIITVRDGEIDILGKARGLRHAYGFLTKEIEKEGGIDFRKPLLLGYTGFDDTELQNFVLESEHLWECGSDELETAIVGSAVGTHAGPGAFAIAFYARK